MAGGYSPLRRWLRQERARDLPAFLRRLSDDQREPINCEWQGELVVEIEDDEQNRRRRRANAILYGRERLPDLLWKEATA